MWAAWTLNVCVASGLTNADAGAEGCAERREALRLHRVHGLPRRLRQRRRPAHAAGQRAQLYGPEGPARHRPCTSEDDAKAVRKSHENPLLKKVYAEYLGEPGGHKAHHILHTSYVAREKLY